MNNELKNKLITSNGINGACEHHNTVMNFDNQLNEYLKLFLSGKVDNDIISKARNCIKNMKTYNTASVRTLELAEEAINIAERIYKKDLELELDEIK